MAESKVTPWEVTGKVDYDKLINEFGTKRITPELRSRMQREFGDLHPMLKRDIYFSHRDLDVALDRIEKKEKVFLYTGRGPSNKLHIGHLVPLMFTKWLQDKLDTNLYLEITDDEKFMYKRDRTLGEIEKIADSDMLDIAALGFNSNKTFMYKDTEYMKHIYKMVIRVAKEINFSTAKAIFGFNNQTSIGMIFWPAIQIVPTMFEKSFCLIPAAIDQDDYWRLQRDITNKLGYQKAAQIHARLLPPLTGLEGKMSSSHPESAIYVTDDEKTVQSKVMKYAFSGGRDTLEMHRKLGGNPDIDVSFQWLRYMFEPDDKRLKQIEDDYRSGKMLTGELKQILIEKLNAFLAKHRDQREKAADRLHEMTHTGKLASKMWDTTYE